MAARDALYTEQASLEAAAAHSMAVIPEPNHDPERELEIGAGAGFQSGGRIPPGGGFEPTLPKTVREQTSGIGSGTSQQQLAANRIQAVRRDESAGGSALHQTPMGQGMVVCMDFPLRSGVYDVQFDVLQCAAADQFNVGIMHERLATAMRGDGEPNTSDYWGWEAATGDLTHGTTDTEWDGQQLYGEGDVVALRLDLNDGMLIAFKNGKRLGVMTQISAYPKGSCFYFCAGMSSDEDSVIISEKRLPSERFFEVAAALNVQARFRAFLQGRRDRKTFEQQQAAAKKIQAIKRGKDTRSIMVRKHAAATKIQACQRRRAGAEIARCRAEALAESSRKEAIARAEVEKEAAEVEAVARRKAAMQAKVAKAQAEADALNVAKHAAIKEAEKARIQSAIDKAAAGKLKIKKIKQFSAATLAATRLGIDGEAARQFQDAYDQTAKELVSIVRPALAEAHARKQNAIKQIAATGRLTVVVRQKRMEVDRLEIYCQVLDTQLANMKQQKAAADSHTQGSKWMSVGHSFSKAAQFISLSKTRYDAADPASASATPSKTVRGERELRLQKEADHLASEREFAVKRIQLLESNQPFEIERAQKAEAAHKKRVHAIEQEIENIFVANEKLAGKIAVASVQDRRWRTVKKDVQMKKKASEARAKAQTAQLNTALGEMLSAVRELIKASKDAQNDDYSHHEKQWQRSLARSQDKTKAGKVRQRIAEVREEAESVVPSAAGQELALGRVAELLSAIESALDNLALSHKIEAVMDYERSARLRHATVKVMTTEVKQAEAEPSRKLSLIEAAKLRSKRAPPKMKQKMVPVQAAAAFALFAK